MPLVLAYWFLVVTIYQLTTKKSISSIFLNFTILILAQELML